MVVTRDSQSKALDLFYAPARSATMNRYANCEKIYNYLVRHKKQESPVEMHDKHDFTNGRLESNQSTVLLRLVFRILRPFSRIFTWPVRMKLAHCRLSFLLKNIKQVILEMSVVKRTGRACKFTERTVKNVPNRELDLQGYVASRGRPGPRGRGIGKRSCPN